MVEVLEDEEEKDNFLVASVPSTKEQDEETKDLFDRVSVVVLPTRVSVVVGKVKVPVLLMVDITGADEKVLTAVIV